MISNTGSIDEIIDRLVIMQTQEIDHYTYHQCCTHNESRDVYPNEMIDIADHDDSSTSMSSTGTREDNVLYHYVNRMNSIWREKICQWSYNVVDHFDISREVVDISLNLFDRFIALATTTMMNTGDDSPSSPQRCNGSLALLASLTTLHIAIKLNHHQQSNYYDDDEAYYGNSISRGIPSVTNIQAKDSRKCIRLSTLVSLSRGQFSIKDIEKMEMNIFTTLNWFVHPPTQYAFIWHYLFFLPNGTSNATRKQIYDTARYLCELAVCDVAFVPFRNSVIAFSAIMNVIEDLPTSVFSLDSRAAFIQQMECTTNVSSTSSVVNKVQKRIRQMYMATTSMYNAAEISQDDIGENMIPAATSTSNSNDTEQTIYKSSEEFPYDESNQASPENDIITCEVGGDKSRKSLSSPTSVDSNHSNTYDMIQTGNSQHVPMAHGDATKFIATAISSGGSTQSLGGENSISSKSSSTMSTQSNGSHKRHPPTRSSQTKKRTNRSKPLKIETNKATIMKGNDTHYSYKTSKDIGGVAKLGSNSSNIANMTFQRNEGEKDFMNQNHNKIAGYSPSRVNCNTNKSLVSQSCRSFVAVSPMTCSAGGRRHQEGSSPLLM